MSDDQRPASMRRRVDFQADEEDFTISREPVSPETAHLVAEATNGGGAPEQSVRTDDEVEDGYAAVREVIHKWPGDAERNAVIWHAIQAYQCAVAPDVGQLQIELKRERMLSRMAQQHAMRCDAEQAAAEAKLARADARYAGLNAHHLRTVADHRAEMDALKATVERVKAVRDGWYGRPHMSDYADELDVALDGPEDES